jgi:hypothetical protein
MPAGDPQRTWFPEMIDVLRTEWTPGISWMDMIALRDRLENMLHLIRDNRTIKSPTFFCPNCNEYHATAHPKVSVRAMILSLNRFNIAPSEDVKRIEKEWAKYRKDRNLDLYGNPSIENEEQA